MRLAEFAFLLLANFSSPVVLGASEINCYYNALIINVGFDTVLDVDDNGKRMLKTMASENKNMALSSNSQDSLVYKACG